MYVRDNVTFKPRTDLDFCTSTIDTVFIEIVKEGKNLIVGTVYKSPDTCGAEFNDHLEECLGKVNKENKQCYIAGDFNFDLLSYALHSDTNAFIDTMYYSSFLPLITKPTRVTTNSFTCIDNVFTNVLNKPILPGILYSDVSDHFPIFQVTNSLPPNYHTHLNRNNASQVKHRIDLNSLCEDLALYDWSLVTSKTNVNEAYDTFIQDFKKMISKHSKTIPGKDRRRSSKNHGLRKAFLNPLVERNACISGI